MVFDGTSIREYEERRKTEITDLSVQLKLEQVPILTPKTPIINPQIPLTHSSNQKNQSALSKPLQNTSAGAQLWRASRQSRSEEAASRFNLSPAPSRMCSFCACSRPPAKLRVHQKFKWLVAEKPQSSSVGHSAEHQPHHKSTWIPLSLLMPTPHCFTYCND